MGKYQSGQMGQTVNLLSFDFGGSSLLLFTLLYIAEIAQLVEHNLAKVRVASSSLVFRSREKISVEVHWSFLFIMV